MDVQAPINRMNQDEFQSYFTSGIRAEVDEFRSPVKKLAEIAGSSIAAAKHWYGGQATANGIYMSRLRASFPNFDARMREIEGKQASFADDFEHILNSTFLEYMRSNPAMAKAMYQQFFKHHNEAEKAA